MRRALIDKADPAADGGRDRCRRWPRRRNILLGYGVTGVGDDEHVARRLGGVHTAPGRPGALNVRIMSYCRRHRAAGDRRRSRRDWLYGDRLRLVGVKLYADGALGSRGAWLKQPYADKPDTRGLQFHSDAEMLASADTRPRRRGFQVATHAIGDAANAQVIAPTSSCRTKYRPATAAGGSSISRSSIRPTSRGSRRPGSSPRCSRRTRPATG